MSHYWYCRGDDREDAGAVGSLWGSKRSLVVVVVVADGDVVLGDG